MRWRGRRGSENIEDRRGVPRRRGPALAGGGIFGLLLIVAVLLLADNPLALLQQIENAQQNLPGAQAPAGDAPVGPIGPAEDELARFVSVVLRDTEDVWTELFRRAGQNYREPTLVMFREQVRSACGFQGAATGPFYCPSDEKVYIDLSFYDDMKTQLGAPGVFAQAYVIAHEVGHHVQNLLGFSDEVQRRRARASQAEGNRLSVRLELQADFFAGVWAHHADRRWQVLEAGDIEEGLRAAAAIGDDRLQRKSRGYVVPESFTHGTSEQRVRWFSKGLESGRLSDGNTFEVGYSDL
ncbi:MAG: metalloprotease [Planctomycetota bacterium]|nr:MAG: metalloprotease [Planctomycetota bacterium]REJ89419.1 MAG: metalloprotease [Planctomycetota bacterium]REK44549.1 MAG: metalloprotease [Planctomycetota bacterium]